MKEIGDTHHQQNRRNMKDTMQDLRDDQHLRTSSCLINSTLGRCLPHPCKLYLFWECCFWMMKMMKVKMTKKPFWQSGSDSRWFWSKLFF